MVFFEDNDRFLYLSLFRKYAQEHEVECIAYCLMNNHVHFIVVPADGDALRKTFARLDHQYACRINRREGWTGSLWQERFLSYPLSTRHLYAAVRYVELNPVKAGLVTHAADYPWSSARAHCLNLADSVLSNTARFDPEQKWTDYLGCGSNPFFDAEIEEHLRTSEIMGSTESVTVT